MEDPYDGILQRRACMSHIMVNRWEQRLQMCICVESHYGNVTGSQESWKSAAPYPWYDWTMQLLGLNTRTIDL